MTNTSSHTSYTGQLESSTDEVPQTTHRKISFSSLCLSFVGGELHMTGREVRNESTWSKELTSLLIQFYQFTLKYIKGNVSHTAFYGSDLGIPQVIEHLSSERKRSLTWLLQLQVALERKCQTHSIKFFRYPQNHLQQCYSKCAQDSRERKPCKHLRYFHSTLTLL